MTSATDELRRMLDERGVFWIDIPRTDFKRTCWKSSAEQAGYFYYDEYDSGVTNLEASQLAPEQAIAATLGVRTCRKVYLVETSDELIDSWFPFGLYLHREAAEDCAEALRREDDGVLCFARVSELKVVDDG